MLAAGWQALERDDFAAAERTARAALAARADDGEALYLLGSTFLFQNRFDEALSPLRDALRLAPRRGVGHRLGYCYLALGALEAAEDMLRREIERYPDLVPAYNALGVALIRQAKRDEALTAFREAARLDPRSAEANSNLANVLSELGRDAEALPYLQRAVEANPTLADAHHNLGTLLQAQKRHEEAIAAFGRALELAPRLSYTLGYLLWSELAICRWDALEARTDALLRQVRDAVPCAPFVLVGTRATPAEQRLCAELHMREKLPRLPAPLAQGARRRAGRLRLAYLSADFCEHATAYLAVRLFELHDRSGFEVIGISYGADDDSPMRRRLERAFDRFIDAREKSDAQAAALLREMEVDIAIDLKGHTTGARPGILAYRPAPVQVSFLGYPGTMGAPFIDYLLVDRRVLPPAEQQFYAEKVAYLPDSYQVNDGERAISTRAVGRADVGLPANGFVFCCFNNCYKITPATFAVWMRLLAALSGSVLWLLEDHASASANLRLAAGRAGVDPARLVFAPRLPHAEHLARHRVADLFLDTLPCNAHTTASDALWAGLPVLTAAGTTFAGRVASSLLHAVGLPQLVTDSLASYEALALEIARDAGLLAELKRKLTAQRTTCALFDTVRFCRHIEAAYLAMWQRHLSGAPPAALSID